MVSLCVASDHVFIPIQGKPASGNCIPVVLGRCPGRGFYNCPDQIAQLRDSLLPGARHDRRLQPLFLVFGRACHSGMGAQIIFWDPLSEWSGRSNRNWLGNHETGSGRSLDCTGRPGAPGRWGGSRLLLAGTPSLERTVAADPDGDSCQFFVAVFWRGPSAGQLEPAV